MLWEELNWAEFEKLVPEKYDTAILPVGTIEAHGVAPLGTDNLIPMEMARLIAKDLGAIVAPPVNYGITRTLLAYPGSLSVVSETFEKYVTEIMLSICDCKFKKLVVLNGHGGNNEQLGRAARAVWQATKIKVAVVHWWMCCDDIVEKIYGRGAGTPPPTRTPRSRPSGRSSSKKSSTPMTWSTISRPVSWSIPTPGRSSLIKMEPAFSISIRQRPRSISSRPPRGSKSTSRIYLSVGKGCDLCA